MNRSGFVLLGVAMLFGCSDDNNNIDGPTSTADGRVIDGGASAIDGGTTADGPTGNFVTIALTVNGEPSACGAAGSSAMGSATVTVSDDNSTVTVNVTYSGLSTTPAAAGHIHFGTTADNGPIVLPFPANPASGSTFTLHASDYINAGTGNPTAPATFADFVTMMKAGGHAYVNLHTPACTGGEIRGELPAFPTP